MASIGRIILMLAAIISLPISLITAAVLGGAAWGLLIPGVLFVLALTVK